MSLSMMIVCDDCKVMLGIGQSTMSPPHRMLYKTEEDLSDLERFLFAHEGHALRVGDIDSFDYEFFE